MRSAVLLLLALFVLIGCGPSAAPGSSASAESAEEAEYQKELEKDFASGQEARAWLAREDTRLFEISKEYGSEIVEKLYAAGAPTVKMIGAEKLSDTAQIEIGATFVAEMPTDPAKRTALLKAKQEIFEEEQPDKDTGQKYLPIHTD